MKLKFENADISIANDSPEAEKILQGYEFSFDGKKLTVSQNKKYYDISEFEKKIETDTATKKDIDGFLKELVKIYKQVKYNIYE